jgi:GAF domain-containing protein
MNKPTNPKQQSTVDDLLDVFSKAALGDFSSDISIDDPRPEMAEIRAGIQVMLEAVREKTNELNQLNDELEKMANERTISVQQRGNILETAAHAAKIFLSAKNWEDEIQDVLNRLGTSTNVSRVYIFRAHQATHDLHRLLFSQTHEWVAEGTSPQMENTELQEMYFPDLGLARLEQKMLKGETFKGNVKDLPKAEQDIFLQQDIKSIIILPIFASSQLWGFIGFDECIVEREWDEVIISALQIMTNLVGAAIGQSEREKELQQRTRELELLNQSFVGRELRMSELKQRIRELEKRLGEAGNPVDTDPHDL